MLSAPESTETLRTPVQPMRRNKHQFFINSSNKKAKTITLHIQGLEGTVSLSILVCACLNVVFTTAVSLHLTVLKTTMLMKYNT